MLYGNEENFFLEIGQHKVKKIKFSSVACLNMAQFLGAMNDNIFKLLIVYFCLGIYGDQYSSIILSLVGAVYVIPFIFFSSMSGMLADRYSKRNILVICKWIELFVMLLGVVFLSLQSPVGAFITIFLMAVHSTLFGPSKYGIIPELVDQQEISKTNGLITSMTFLAIILGTFLASFLTQISGRNFIFAGTVCATISLLGLAASLGIKKTPPAGSKKKFHPWFFIEVYKTTLLASQRPILLASLLGSAYFLFAGAFVQLNMIPYAIHVLNWTDVQGGYLFLLSALGIGTGAYISGRISGKVVELGLVPLGGIGMGIAIILLDVWSEKTYLIPFTIIILGMLGGIYLVPLDSYIQFAAPNKHRGQIVATTNFYGFFGVFCASLFLYIISNVLGLPADKGFTFLGILTICVVLAISWVIYHHVTRYIGMIMARMHYRLTLVGSDIIPLGKPALYLCPHTAWNDTILLLGSQRYPVRFFAEKKVEREHSALLRWCYRLLRIVSVPSVELIEDDAEKIRQIRESLRKGISVCVFVHPDIVGEQFEKLKEHFKPIVSGTGSPLIIVQMHKGEKQVRSDLFRPVTEKFRVPATIEFTGYA